LNHHVTPDFWQLYNSLPLSTQKLAKKNYKLLKRNPKHPSIHFKNVGKYWSARVGSQYRALAVCPDSDIYVWFWIGTHTEYDKLIK
jgi:hypothetical protein